MRTIIRTAVLVAALGLPSAAAAEMDEAFGNTVESRYPDGGWVRHWFNPDGTYSARFSSGQTISARWRVEGNRVCLNRIQPAVMMISRFCSPLIQATVGQSWVSRDPLGRRVTNVLQPGR